MTNIDSVLRNIFLINLYIIRHVFTNRVKALPEKKMPLSHPLIVTGQLKKEDVNSFKTTLGKGLTNEYFYIQC